MSISRVSIIGLLILIYCKNIQNHSMRNVSFPIFHQAKPLLHKGKGAINELLDPRIKCTLTNSNQIARVIEAAAACITSEESRRPSIGEIIAILKGEEEPIYSKRKKSSFLGNGLVIDCYSQLHQTNSEMKSHLALAMLGVSEFEDDDHLYGR